MLYRKHFTFLAIMFLLTTQGFAATYTVTSTADSGAGTLREAAGLANAASDLDTIDFNTGPATITLSSTISFSNPVIINGGSNQEVTTASKGFAVLTFASGSAGSTVQDIALTYGNVGIAAYSGSEGLSVTGCRIGVDWAGNTYVGNGWGIYAAGSSACQIGGTATERNIISCNTSGGLYMNGHTESKVQGNYFGVSPDGSTEMENGGDCIFADNAVACLIGGDRSAGYGNIIAGSNSAQGIRLNSGFGNTVCGNVIGLNADQSLALSNSNGVYCSAGGNFIGLPLENYENIIAGNGSGILFVTTNAQNNVVQNNLIGINSSGVSFNGNYGIMLIEGNNLIGGYRNTAFYERNIISGNAIQGIHVASSNNTISGNYIGTGLDGNTAKENGQGIYMSNAYGNLIGGANADGNSLLGNVILGHDNSNAAGINMYSGGGNTVVGNWIGLTASGTQGIQNYFGIYMQSGMDHCQIGGNNDMLANRFGKSNSAQIKIGSGSQFNKVQGNFLGLDAAGTSAFSHTGTMQIQIEGGAYNLIGGVNSGEGNRIAGYGNGVHINGGISAMGNTLVGNVIGLLADGVTLPSQKMVRGISIFQSAGGNFFGLKSTQGNLIAGATYAGIYIQTGSHNVGVYSNTIVACSTYYRNDSGVNNSKAAPMVLTATTSTISGTTEANDYVEVFLSDGSAGAYGGSVRVIGETTADGSGNWSITPSGLSYGDVVTAIASNSQNDSSPFTANVELIEPTVTSTATPTITPTHTVTLTQTATPSFTPTFTITPSETPSTSQTTTPTETPTSTPSAEFTSTMTPTLTLTTTPTPLNTITPTPSETQTATTTPSSSATPTVTMTFSPTPSGTATPIVTITQTFTPISTSTETPIVNSDYLVYPNPARDQVSIFIPLHTPGPVTVHIYNVSGERVCEIQESSLSNNTIIWTCQQNGAGIYIARIIRDRRLVKTLKIAVIK